MLEGKRKNELNLVLFISKIDYELCDTDTETPTIILKK